MPTQTLSTNELNAFMPSGTENKKETLPELHYAGLRRALKPSGERIDDQQVKALLPKEPYVRVRSEPLVGQAGSQQLLYLNAAQTQPAPRIGFKNAGTALSAWEQGAGHQQKDVNSTSTIRGLSGTQTENHGHEGLSGEIGAVGPGHRGADKYEGGDSDISEVIRFWEAVDATNGGSRESLSLKFAENLSNNGAECWLWAPGRCLACEERDTCMCTDCAEDCAEDYDHSDTCPCLECSENRLLEHLEGPVSTASSTTECEIAIESDNESIASTNSWVDDENSFPTDDEMLDPEDFETEPLPKLSAAQAREYIYLQQEGLVPARDESEGVYRCLNCQWEALEDKCESCGYVHAHFPGSAVDLSRDDSSDSQSDIADSTNEIGQLPSTLSNEASTTEEDADTVGDWLSNLAGRLESINESARRFMPRSCSLADRERMDSLVRESNKHDQDSRALLRLERWDRKFDHTRNEKAQGELKEQIATFETKLRNAQKEKEWLEDELAIAKSELRQHLLQEIELNSLRKEVEAYKTITLAQLVPGAGQLSETSKRARDESEELGSPPPRRQRVD